MLRGGAHEQVGPLPPWRFAESPWIDTTTRRMKLGVAAGTVTVVRVAHEQQRHHAVDWRRLGQSEQKNDETAGQSERKDKWAADAAYRAFVVRAVGKEHGIASPTVARPITVKGPFSEDQLKAFPAPRPGVSPQVKQRARPRCGCLSDGTG